MTSTRVIFSVVIGAVASLANGCGPVCGNGTTEVDGECVADAPAEGEGEEGEGDAGEGEGEGEGLVCGPGTVISNDGASCVPACRADQVFVDNACECPVGSVELAGFGCQLDAALCGDGTVLVDNACQPLSAPPQNDDDAHGGAVQVITLPPVGEKADPIGGVIDPPIDGTPDSDQFTFDATAGQRLRIELVSFGAEAASFAVQGTPTVGVESGVENYVRFGLPGGGRRAIREIVIPLDGSYGLVVGDKATIIGAGLPSSGPDQSYALIIETLAEPAPTTLLANVPQTDSHDLIKSFILDSTTIPTGIADVNMTTNEPSTIDAMWFVSGGKYVEFPGGPAFVPQDAVGTVVHADYFAHADAVLGATSTYTITAKSLSVADGPDAGSTDEIDTNGEDLSFFSFDLSAGNIYRFVVELPLTSSVDARVLLVDGGVQTVLDQCTEATNAAGRQEFTCTRFVADDAAAGTTFLVVIDDGAGSAVAVENTAARVSFDEAPVALVQLNDTDSADVVVAAVDADGEFGAPWTRIVFTDSIALSADLGPAFDVHDVATADLIIAGVDELDDSNGVEQAAGFSFLVHPKETGTITFSGSALPYAFENEATNASSAGATALPEAPSLAPELGDSAAAGVLSEGDTDFWSIDVDGPGVLTVTLDGSPFGFEQDFGDQDDGDAGVQIFDTDGVTPISGPPAGSASAFVDGPGPYFVAVTIVDFQFFGLVFPGFPGDYALGFSFDDQGTEPSTCDVLTAITTTTSINGNNSIGPRTGGHVPADDTCFGFAPANYEGGEDAYLVTVPGGGIVVADINAQFDAAIAVLDGEACNASCVAGADTGNGVEHVEFANTDDAAKDVVLVVEGFAGDAGSYTLSVQLFGSVCRIGESRCTGDVRETCNADGTGFDSRTCLEGCAFDTFDRVASCNVECGPGSPRPDDSCDGDSIATCVDGLVTNIDCPVSCDDSNGAVCSFGVCAPGSSTCADNGSGVFVETLCDANGGQEIVRSCATNACDGDVCGALVFADLVSPNLGVCDDAAVETITTSGVLTLNVDAAGADFEGVDFDFCATSGDDVFYRLVTTGHADGST